MPLDDGAIYELRQLCTSSGLTQESLSSLIDAELSLPSLVRSDAFAMAQAKKAGLGMAERQKLKEGLRRHKDEVLSAEEPRLVEVGDDAEAHHIVAAQLQMAEERQRMRQQQAEDAKGVEVVKNGAIRDHYRWTQELSELTISVELPPGTAKKDVICKIGPQSLTAGIRGLPTLVDGQLHARVRVDDCMWQLQDSHRLVITMPKFQLEKEEWWPRLLVGEAEIDVSTCEAGESTNLFSTTGTRMRLQKIELPERPSDGKKFKNPAEAEKAWKDFFTDFPNMRAYELNIKGKDDKEAEEQLRQILEPHLAKNTGDWEKPTSD